MDLSEVEGMPRWRKPGDFAFYLDTFIVFSSHISLTIKNLELVFDRSAKTWIDPRNKTTLQPSVNSSASCLRWVPQCFIRSGFSWTTNAKDTGEPLGLWDSKDAWNTSPFLFHTLLSVPEDKHKGIPPPPTNGSQSCWVLKGQYWIRTR